MEFRPIFAYRFAMNIMIRRPVLVLLLSAMAAGCSSTERLAQRNNERCEARGYQPKTDAFNDCVVRLESEREVRVESRRLEMLEKSSNPTLGR